MQRNSDGGWKTTTSPKKQIERKKKTSSKNSPTKLARISMLQHSLAARDQEQSSSPSPASLSSSASSASTVQLPTYNNNNGGSGATIDASAKTMFRSHSEATFTANVSPYEFLSEKSYVTPSDRIGRNYTLSSKSLTIRELQSLLPTPASPLRKKSPWESNETNDNSRVSPVKVHSTQTLGTAAAANSTSIISEPAISPEGAWASNRQNRNRPDVIISPTSNKSPTKIQSSSTITPPVTSIVTKEASDKAFNARVQSVALCKKNAIPSMPTSVSDRILSHLSGSTFNDISKSLVEGMFEEVYAEYYRSIAKAIVTYEILDPAFAKNLGIINTTSDGGLFYDDTFRVREFVVLRIIPGFTTRTSSEIAEAKQLMLQSLKVVDPVMTDLKSLWEESTPPVEWEPSSRGFDLPYCDILLFTDSNNTSSIESFLEQVKTRCEVVRDGLKIFWLGAASDVTSKRFKIKSVNNHETKVLNTASALMSRQLRDLTHRSLEAFVSFIEGGNNSSSSCVISLSLDVRKRKDANDDDDNIKNHVQLVPDIKTLTALLHSGVDAIVNASRDFPRMDTQVKRSSDSSTALDSKIAAASFLGPSTMRVEESQDFKERITLSVNDVVSSVEESTLSYFTPYIPILNHSRLQRIHQKIQGLTSNKNPDAAAFEMFHEEITWLQDAKHSVANDIPDTMDSASSGIYKICTKGVKSQLQIMLDECIATCVKVIQDANRVLMNSIVSQYTEISEKLVTPVVDSTELQESVAYYKNVDTKLAGLNQSLTNDVYRNLKFCIAHNVVTSMEDLHLFSIANDWPSKIKNFKTRASDMQALRLSEMQVVLSTRHSSLSSTCVSIEKKIERLGEISSVVEAPSVVKRIASLESALVEVENGIDAIEQQEQLLCIEEDNDDNDAENKTNHRKDLQVLQESLQPLSDLWRVVHEVVEKSDEWRNSSLHTLDAEAIGSIVETQRRSAIKFVKEFERKGAEASTSVAEVLKSMLDEIYDVQLPLLSLLCNPGIKERHWKDMSSLTSLSIKPTERDNDDDDDNDDSSIYTLDTMLALGLQDHVDTIEETCVTASKEYSLEKALGKMKDEWKTIEVLTKSYRETGTFILQSTDEIQGVLDDHIVKTQAMRGSRYNKPYLNEIKAWEKTLTNIQDIIDNWLRVQATWLYLEPIFGSDDIMRQMPTEGALFKNVDKKWRSTMSDTVRNPLALEIRDGTLEDLQESNKELETIQSGLNDYLETKRLYFPRFFFLSNDELLEILAETKDPLRVQPHLKKAFDGISSLEFQKPSLDITGLVSGEGEYVKIPYEDLGIPTVLNPSSSGGNVEIWLQDVETLMRKSVAHHLDTSLADSAVKDRLDWVCHWPGQIVLAVNQLKWTKNSEDAISNNQIQEYLETLRAELVKTVELVRGELPKLIRITLGALVVMDVHNRNVIEELRGITDVSDFDWLAQLRYYWHAGRASALSGKPETLECRMINAVAFYAYEYLGNNMRLVITPLTDRCYRTLMGAVHLNLGGAPEGPAGTGKTETTKDLAKAIAIQCVVTNCSDGLDYLAMGKFFKGLASSGAWACFDEFNRIQLEVLSVVAQQILSIQIAKSAKVEKFNFEGTLLSLNPTCCPFITMNPGYAGRAELPDNLKVLFRTVAMMVPDYSMIAEIMLYSYGYLEAGGLSKKITSTYTLCSEQLSSQSHYDYGMRAVMAVLRAAGNLKRTSGHLPEDELVLRSIIDVNLPKFLSPDVPLFHGITSDLFPGVVVDPPDRSRMLDAMTRVCESKGLEATPNFVEKVIQIYEMMIVRHGFMIVGLPFSGKSSAWNVLANTLSTLHQEYPEDDLYCKVAPVVINPKSITMGQLYGQFDAVSHEWSDGILAISYRNMATAKSNEKMRRWLLFDGPVDAIWIENMNTVLDDNRKLCLMSGEIIAMSSEMSIMFEPMDLLVASPATVSRCGMVYMEPTQLGWVPIMTSWVKKTFNESNRERVTFLFNWILEPCIQFIRKETTELCPTVDANLAVSCMNVISSKLSDDVKNNDMSDCQIESTFLFAVIWSVGQSIPEEGRVKFNTFFKLLLSDVASIEKEYGRVYRGLQLRGWKIPSDNSACAVSESIKKTLQDTSSSIYDYYLEDANFVKWNSLLDSNYEIPLNTSYNHIVVPTVSSTQLTVMTTLLLKNHHNVLIVGPTGTGKSCYLTKLLASPAIQSNNINNISLAFSAKTSASMTQSIIDGKLDKRRKGVYGPPMGKRLVIFVDDLNMPEVETYGAQPPIELLRQLVDSHGWFNLSDTMAWQSIVDTAVLASMGPAGGGRNSVTPRFLRHFNLLCLTELDDSTLTTIFSTIVDWNFKSGFASDIYEIASNSIVPATLALYKKALETLLPTPSKSHYTFNLRDFSRVVQGMLLLKNSDGVSPDTIVRLWTHEVLRVFGDRLVDDSDRQWFHKTQSSFVKTYFKKDFEKVFGHLGTESESVVSSDNMRGLLFGDYAVVNAAHPRPYCEINMNSEEGRDGGINALISTFTTYLEDYNAVSKGPMNLVMFLFAVEHTSRILRVLKMPGGNSLLVGVGGSGRQSLTKLATYIMDFNLRQIEISKTYTMVEWREDLKDILRDAGTASRPVVFLFSDSQIKYEGFVEDINNMLNSGEIPNLFPYDEKVAIAENVRAFAKAEFGKAVADEMSTDALFAFFVTRVRTNLHVVLAFSPIGDAFRERLRKFPSLINCCTIDWFTAWPSDALVAVAEKFLKDVEFPSDALRASIVNMCQYFHTSAISLSSKFLATSKRHNYVTPTSYLELIMAFKTALSDKRTSVTTARDRYVVGLEKLAFAENNVAVMQKDLEDLQPVLDKSKKDTDELMATITEKLPSVTLKRTEVTSDVAVADEEAARCNAQKESVEADLAEAIPALNEALKALDTIKPSEINEVKMLQKPPAGVKLVCEAVCVMLGIKSQRIPDPEDSSKRIMDYWGPSQKMLGDASFISTLKTYDKDNIDVKIMKVIRSKYLTDENFTPERAMKASKAAYGLCKWVHSMALYDSVSKVVAPKREALAVAEATLEATMVSLRAKQEELKDVEDGLKALQDSFDDATAKKLALENQVTETGKMLTRAATLITSLGGEKARWTTFATDLAIQYEQLTGDVLISAGVLAYLGPFTSVYRKSSIGDWVSHCKTLEISCSDSPSLGSTLGDAVLIRKWNIDGLPTDSFSVDNGIVVFNARRWPLMIDPQGQANKWVRNMESTNDLSVIKLTDKDFLRTLENAVQFGNPVLLENINEELDPSLESLLLKQVFKSGGVECIRLGDSTVEYSPNFRFYMTTKLRNPHYLPDVSVKVTLINFMITPVGLEDQLLGIVVAQERPDLEEQKNTLIVQGAENKRLLKDIEDKILYILSSSSGNILEDETAITTLNQSKVVADEIKEKQAIAEKTEREIDDVRSGYRPVAYSSQVLFFCIDELANIEPVYQYSLVWFINLFISSINGSEASPDIEERLSILDSHFTYSLYKNICRSLLEKDKFMFSFLLTISILQGKSSSSGKDDDDNDSCLFDNAEWYFLLTGGVSTGDDVVDNPVSSWLSDKQWAEVCRLSTTSSSFKTLPQEIQMYSDEYKALYQEATSAAISEMKFPGTFETISPLKKLCLVRCIRPDLVVYACQEFVVTIMGTKFVEPPTFDLESCYSDSSVISPLIFILSPGSDPITSVLKYAAPNDKQVDVISLGQGQGPIAERMISVAREKGSWVVLQNCHLAPSWMPAMEKIMEDLSSDNTHEDFRLWCTTYPSEVFPSSVLQIGVKMTNEPPSGLRANLLSSYKSTELISQDMMLDSSLVFKKLLYSLCFFHALVRERRSFGPLGWNILYEFNESDLKICIRQLAMFIDEASGTDVIPLKALRYTTGECNYGGRVTDDKDRRTLHCILNRFYTSTVVTDSSYSFDSQKHYGVVPEDCCDSVQDVIDFIESAVPVVPPSPEIYGLNTNATITRDQNETGKICRDILKTQSSTSTSTSTEDDDSTEGSSSSDSIIADVATAILKSLPSDFDMEVAQLRYPVKWEDSMNSVLCQELVRFNKLLQTIRTSLTSLLQALKGLVVMNDELEELSRSVLFSQIPELWKASSYPSLKSLSSYVVDLRQRLEFFNKWLTTSPPSVFWMSGFFFTQAFLTGASQNYARKYTIPIDQIGFKHEVVIDQENIVPPEDGVYINGLFIEGAMWNTERHVLDEAQPKVLFSKAPVIWFKPMLKSALKEDKTLSYTCPVYKTSERRGTLSTTGHSTNFICYIQLLSDKPESHWVQRGVAMLTQLDD